MAVTLNSTQLYNRITQFNKARQKDWQTYESFKTKPKKPTPAEISRSVPPSRATQNTDAAMKELRSFKFTNSQNYAQDNARHEQLKAQLRKEGYISKAAFISRAYQTRSDKGEHLLGY